MIRKAWCYSYITLILILVLVTKNAVGITCEFCNKEFIRLSKHTWRFKSNITSITTVATESTSRPLPFNESLVTVNNNSNNNNNNNNNNNEIIPFVNQDFDPHENENVFCWRINRRKKNCLTMLWKRVRTMLLTKTMELLFMRTYLKS